MTNPSETGRLLRQYESAVDISLAIESLSAELALHKEARPLVIKFLAEINDKIERLSKLGKVSLIFGREISHEEGIPVPSYECDFSRKINPYLRGKKRAQAVNALALLTVKSELEYKGKHVELFVRDLSMLGIEHFYVAWLQVGWEPDNNAPK